MEERREPQSIGEWEAVLERVLSGATAASVSQYLEWLLARPSCIGPLFRLMAESRNAGIRQLSAVLLRGRVCTHWKHLSSSERNLIKSKSLERIGSSGESSYVVSAIIQLVSMVARVCSPPREQWPELLPALGALVKSDVDARRSCGMRLLNALTDTIASHLKSEFAPLCAMVSAGLRDGNSDVRVNAMRSMVAMVAVGESEQEAALLRKMLSEAVGFTQLCIKRGLEDEIGATLEFFKEVVESELPIVADRMPQLVAFVLDMAANRKMPAALRQEALVFFQWAASYKRKALLATDKLPALLVAIFGYAVELADDEVDPLLPLTPFEMACECIDHFARHLPPRRVYKPVATFVVNWSAPQRAAMQRRMAIVTLGLLADGCASELCDDLDKVLPLLLNAMQKDEDARVREAACVTFGQFAVHLQPEIAEPHERLLPAIVRRLDDPVDAVRVAALYGISAYVEHLDEELSRYLKPLMTRLLRIVGGGDATSVEQKEIAVACISVAAAAADADFMPYAKPVIELCRRAMSQQSKQLVVLRARATECIGITAVSIGRSSMAPVIEGFLKLALQGLKHKQAHELREYTWTMFSNFAIMLGADIAPYLRTIVPIVIDSCLSDAGILARVDDVGGVGAAAAAASSSSSSSSPAKSLSDLTADDKLDGITVRESFVDEKTSACQSLGVFAANVGVAFLPWLEDAINTLLTARRYFHPDVRCACLQALAETLGVVHEAFPPAAQWRPGVIDARTINPTSERIIETVMPVMIGAMSSEPDKDAVGAALKSVSTMATTIGPTMLDRHFIKPIVLAIVALLSGKAACQRRGSFLDDDEDETQDTLQLFFNVTDAAVDIAKAYGAKFAPHAALIFRALQPFCTPNVPMPYRAASIGAVAELVRYMRSSTDYVKPMLPVCLDAVKTDNYHMRRNAAYCLGVLCQFAQGDKQLIGSALGNVAQALQPLLADKDGTSDNAAGALARIMLVALKLNIAVPFGAIYRAVLQALPIREDHEPFAAIAHCSLELYAVAARSNGQDAASKQILALAPFAFVHLGRAVAQSALCADKKRRRNDHTIKPSQQEQILPDDLTRRLISLLKSLYAKFETAIKPLIQSSTFNDAQRQALHSLIL
jgi:importin-4